MEPNQGDLETLEQKPQFRWESFVLCRCSSSCRVLGTVLRAQDPTLRRHNGVVAGGSSEEVTCLVTVL